jgi:glucosamine--fructose-6-phosphate aminotransferase (isomerizing)
MKSLTSRVIEGAYLCDILEQADVLKRVAAKLSPLKLDSAIPAGLRSSRFRRVVLTGMGSSLHASYPLHRNLVSAGITSYWIESAELLLGFESLYQPDTLLVAVSQSGESAELATLAKRADEFGHMIGVTNNPNSQLGKNCGTVLTMEAGAESTVSCKTYVSTLAVLNWLSAQLIAGQSDNVLADLASVEPAVRAYVNGWCGHVEELLLHVEGITSVFVTGRGSSLATAGTGGLILKESTRRHAEGMSAAAFRHGPLEMAGENVLVLIFEGDEATIDMHRRLADDIVQGGGKAQLIGPRTATLDAFRTPGVPESVRTIIEILPIQMLSLALAARDGIEAGRFQRATKITNVA